MNGKKAYPFCIHSPQLPKVQGSDDATAAKDLPFIYDSVICDIDKHIHERDRYHCEWSCTLECPHWVAYLRQSVIRI